MSPKHLLTVVVRFTFQQFYSHFINAINLYEKYNFDHTIYKGGKNSNKEATSVYSCLFCTKHYSTIKLQQIFSPFCLKFVWNILKWNDSKSSVKTIKCNYIHKYSLRKQNEMLFNMKNTWSVRWGWGKPAEKFQECRHATSHNHLSYTLASQKTTEGFNYQLVFYTTRFQFKLYVERYQPLWKIFTNSLNAKDLTGSI